MAVGTSNFGELLWPGIKEIYGERYKWWPKLYTQIFDVMQSDKAFEKFQGVTGFGLFGIKDQGKAVPYADPYLGFQTIIDHGVPGGIPRRAATGLRGTTARLRRGDHTAVAERPMAEPDQTHCPPSLLP